MKSQRLRDFFPMGRQNYLIHVLARGTNMYSYLTENEVKLVSSHNMTKFEYVDRPDGRISTITTPQSQTSWLCLFNTPQFQTSGSYLYNVRSLSF